MTGRWTVEPVPALRGYTVEWLEPGLTLLSRRNRLYRAAEPTGRRELVGEIPAPLWQRLSTRVRPAQRLLRFMVYNALPLSDDEIFVTFGKRVGVFSGGRFRELPGLRRPCRVLRRGCAVAGDGSVVWGEYIGNEERDSISVYRYEPGGERLETVHRFAAGEIRHVHGVYRDPHTDALWCLAGDLPEECRILRTDSRFSQREIVGQGDESWRAVSLLFTGDAIYYASDAEFRQNHIFRIDRRSGERTRVAEVDGPVYYSHAVGDDLFFATTAELCPSQREPQATLWNVTPAGRVDEVCSFRKDLARRRLTTMLFMPGTLHFPLGPGLGGESWLSGVGLRGLDHRTARLVRRPEGGTGPD